MSKIKEIKEFIWNNINRDGNVTMDGIDDIFELIHITNNNFNCKLEVLHTGGFESPGYDVDCYAWAGIIDGELYFDSIEQESY